MKIRSFTFNPFQENTYILSNQRGEGMLIDPGFSTNEEVQLVHTYLKEEDISIKIIFLTHAHLDHILGLSLACEQFALIPYLHQAEKVIFDNAANFAVEFGMDTKNLYQGPVQWMDNNTRSIENTIEEIHILHTPGHSPGSVCYFFPQEGMVIAGDLIFQGSIGRTDLPGGSYKELIESIKSHIITLPADTIIYPGHGPPTYVAEEIDNNPFLKEI